MSRSSAEQNDFYLKQQKVRFSALAALDFLEQPISLPVVLQRIVDITSELLPASGGASIVLWDEKKSSFFTSASNVSTQEEGSTARRIRKEGGATRWIIENKCPLVVSDILEDPFGANSMLSEEGIRSYVGVPIYSEKKVVAVLYALERQLKQVDQLDLDFLTVLAGRAGTTITFIELYSQIKELSVRDTLTELYNRRGFIELASQEYERAQRHRVPLSLLMIDIDYFKRINDEHGHHYGDLVLKGTAESLIRTTRSIDIHARSGGEEFIILMPETDIQTAHIAAERIRHAIETNPIQVDAKRIHITVSIGIAQLDKSDKDITDLVIRADAAMYKAKQAGRNRVALAD